MKYSKRGTSSAIRGIRPEFDSLESDGLNCENSSTTMSGKATSSKSVTIPTAISQQTDYIYGWKPEYATMQRSFDPYDTWLIGQARSYLNTNDVTAVQARELFKTIDPSTRKTRPAPTERRPAGFWAALRALVYGGIVLFMASGCNAIMGAEDSKQTSDYETVAVFGHHSAVHKFYDRSEGVVCYVFVSGAHRGGINCMVARGQGDNQ